jgi:hypothetical protein
LQVTGSLREQRREFEKRNNFCIHAVVLLLLTENFVLNSGQNENGFVFN